MKDLILKLVKEEDGASMVEYILLLALIAVVLIAGFKAIGTSGDAKLDAVDAGITGATGT